MPNYLYYIIGIIIVILVGIFLSTNQNPKNDQDRIVGNDNLEQNVATHSEDATTTTQTNNSTTTNNSTKNMETENKQTYKVTMETNKGTIVLELNHKIAPKTVENFVKLSNQGFYNGIKFHRVINGFMIQGGDPLTKDDKMVNAWGTGGPGYKFSDEITDAETYRTGYKRGVLAMANSGPNTNGSQFFIMHKDTPLPPNYTIFGKVVTGLETVDAIANVETGAADRPVQAVVINKVSVE